VQHATQCALHKVSSVARILVPGLARGLGRGGAPAAKGVASRPPHLNQMRPFGFHSKGRDLSFCERHRKGMPAQGQRGRGLGAMFSNGGHRGRGRGPTGWARPRGSSREPGGELKAVREGAQGSQVGVATNLTVPLNPQPRMSTAQGSSPCASSSGKPRRHSRHELQQRKRKGPGPGLRGGARMSECLAATGQQSDGLPLLGRQQGLIPTCEQGPLGGPIPTCQSRGEAAGGPCRRPVSGGNAAALDGAWAEGSEHRETAHAAQEEPSGGVLNLLRLGRQERGQALSRGA